MEMRRFGVGMGESGRALFRLLLSFPSVYIPVPVYLSSKRDIKPAAAPWSDLGVLGGGVKGPRAAWGHSGQPRSDHSGGSAVLFLQIVVLRKDSSLPVYSV